MVKNAKTLLFGPLLLRHRCTNPCCSTTAQFVFLVRVARYANHFSSFLCSPKIPFCRVQFLASRTSRIKLFFWLPLSQLPENPCCYSRGKCCSPLRTVRAGNRFPALVRSFIEPFLESRILFKNCKTPLFWAAAAPPLVHQSMLLYYSPVCLLSESCQICKPFLLSSWFALNPMLPGAVFIQQNEPHETNFLLLLSQLLKIHAALVQASAAHHCKLPWIGTVFLLSFVRP